MSASIDLKLTQSFNIIFELLIFQRSEIAQHGLQVWPMEMHAIIDTDRKESLVIQISDAFMNSLFDLQRIMHFYRALLSPLGADGE